MTDIWELRARGLHARGLCRCLQPGRIRRYGRPPRPCARRDGALGSSLPSLLILVDSYRPPLKYRQRYAHLANQLLSAIASTDVKRQPNRKVLRGTQHRGAPRPVLFAKFDRLDLTAVAADSATRRRTAEWLAPLDLQPPRVTIVAIVAHAIDYAVPSTKLSA